MFVGTSVTAFFANKLTPLSSQSISTLEVMQFAHVVAILNLRRSQCLEGRTKKNTYEGACLFCVTPEHQSYQARILSFSLHQYFGMFALQLSSTGFLSFNDDPGRKCKGADGAGAFPKISENCCNTSFSDKPLSWQLEN